MFREVKKLKAFELDALGLEMKERKAQLMADLGLETAEEHETV